jgi:hypothetical protein
MIARRNNTPDKEETPVAVVVSDTPKEPQKKLGRPKGAGTFQNGVIPEKKIFLFVPRETIPEKDIQRFLQLCDAWIQDLGPLSLKDTDLEEIALYCRERLYIDGLYKTFAEAETIDPNLVTQIEKMTKAMEVRKSNLGSRFIDREGKRKEGSKMTFLDLFEDYSDNVEHFVKAAEEKKEVVSKNRDKFTNSVEYMEGHLLNKPIKDKKDI